MTLSVDRDADECICGDCRACRRVVAGTPPPAVAPSSLSERAAKILSEPVGYRPKPRPKVIRPSSVVRSDLPWADCGREGCSARTQHESRLCSRHRPRTSSAGQLYPDRDFNPAEAAPCAECGLDRVVIKYGRGTTLAGGEGLCELCFDTLRFQAQLDGHESGEDPLTAPRLLRAKRHLARVRGKNGRPFSHDAPHGNPRSFSAYGCRCETCREAKSSYLHKYRKGAR